MKVRLSEEVEQARASGTPIVVLESSVIAQGLPHPVNLEAARVCEEAVRQAGAVPAVVAVVDGVVRCGLSADEVRRLASGTEQRWKVGVGDLASAVLQKATGGTTVSATCAVAAACGLPVFATGGIGGVHRGEGGDVSADLAALARYPGMVVCAGAKSVLDLPRTLEALEALGVPVLGYGTSDFPAFYADRSGLRLEHRADTPELAAEALHAQRDRLGLSQAIVLTVPPPLEVALDKDELDRALVAAEAEASRQGVSGKAVTPFLLARLVEATGGRTLRANVALLAMNARVAGEVAVAYERLRSGTGGRAVP
ncbi:MAG TPA: pseudouridine-5'-phosphate glycosidase [Myxococcaceae bacterium]|nr:pseudouridine-5'-phosphate glycosidase [Myxococcaceae bacterium]